MSTNEQYEEVIRRAWEIFINLDNKYNVRLMALETVCSALRRLEKLKNER